MSILNNVATRLFYFKNIRKTSNNKYLYIIKKNTAYNINQSLVTIYYFSK